MNIAGIMTGTSCDGLDIACLQFRGKSWKQLWANSAPYPLALRQRVLAAQLPGTKLSLKEYGRLHRDLGEWIGSLAAKFVKDRRVDAIACHGQTVAHFPANGFTIQLADPARIAHATGLTTISNFRDGDMAAGGEGAPLAPRFHRALMNDEVGVAIHNLGGISNLTYLGPGGLVLAFDTGPANLWIDAAAELVAKKPFDRDGKLAAAATPDFHAVERILKRKFFSKAPPKSTGRDDFPFQVLLEATRARDARLAATATALTVESIGRAYEKFILKRGHPLRAIRFAGGGARNRFLMQSLQRRLSGIEVTTLENNKYLEAQAFAYFAFLAFKGAALGGPWTGADPKAPSAHIIPGKNWPQLVRKLSAASF